MRGRPVPSPEHYDGSVAQQLFIERTGAGESLVLLHGIVADHHVWDVVVPQLAQTRQVIAVDLPGFGRSTPTGPEFVLEEVAAAIRTGLHDHGVQEPFDLVGHSLGGGLAIDFAARYPTAVRSLTLVAPAGLRPLPPVIANLLTSDRLTSLLRGGVQPRRQPLPNPPGTSAQEPGAVARIRDASRSAARNGQAAAMISTVDLRPPLRQITAPVGVIWGETDWTVPISHLADLLVAQPDAQVIRLPETGHVPMAERPEEFVAGLLTLLQ